MEEEIGRAERHGTNLCCLLVVIEDLDEMARTHGADLPEQTLLYVAGALEPELRRFDRIGRPSPSELLIVLPGADGARGEMVARRVLERLRTIKVESQGARRALAVTVGLVAWSAEMASEDLLVRSRAAARLRAGEPGAQSPPDGRAPGPGQPSARARREGHAWAMGRATGP
jgi:GGDEF domain-containing protein